MVRKNKGLYCNSQGIVEDDLVNNLCFIGETLIVRLINSLWIKFATRSRSIDICIK
jgi:hypothetical protein